LISEIIMPDLGGTGGDVILQEWLVNVGETIRAGQSLFIVHSDKAVVEVEAYRDGILREIRVAAGEVVPLGSVVALLGDSNDEPLDLAEEKETQDRQQVISQLDRGVSSSQPESRIQHRVLATPLARRIAKGEGLDLASLVGSGLQGQVLKRDVMVALAGTRGATSHENPANTYLVPLSPMQRSIADRTRRSKSEIPHYYASISVDMSAIQDLRRKISASLPQSSSSIPSITDVCLCALALTLQEYPTLNASFNGEAILYHTEINLGMVIGLDEGMLVPVIRQADHLNLFQLATKTKQLREHAESGQLKDNEMGGGTFTLSNLGMYGLDNFTAVINPPEAGVLALGAIKEQPIGLGGAIVLRPIMVATLSVDHRVVDGITAARFIGSYKNKLENPICLVINLSQDLG
jgi:pyruvate dehydrogenase E2 component (dihydrolipoyllysine-residue acetyltransferase)